MSNKIYIAGPISGREKKAEKKFDEAEIFLNAKGYEVINPMKLPHDHDKEWKCYMIECIRELITCDEIYMLNCWNKSKGARLELKIAMDLGLTVTYKKP